MVVVQPIKSVKNANLEKINTGSHLSCIRRVLLLDQFATGGNENPLKLWDIETGKINFTAKRVNMIFLVYLLFKITMKIVTVFVFSLNQICFNSNSPVMYLILDFSTIIK